MDKTSNLFLDLNTKPMHNPTSTQQYDEVVEELNRVKWENKKLNEILALVCRNYPGEEEMLASRKRKFDHTCCDECSLGRPREIMSNISRVHVRIDPSDTSLIVRDGYQWRKYGQKVTRDNPSPRAYYKCSYSPTCSVKKKVQRSASDPCVLVATYEGQHNHRAEQPSAAANVEMIDCSRNRLGKAVEGREEEMSEIQQVLVEQMASSLTRNHTFKAALVASITGRLLDDVSEENDDSFSISRVFSQ